MKMEKSAGFVIYIQKEEPVYLLLKYPNSSMEKDYWGLPKGHIENGESPTDAAKRELFEETGLKEEELTVDDDFRESIKYFFKQKDETIFKVVIYFLAKTKRESVKLSDEHEDYRWVGFEEGIDMIPYKNTKDVLRKANRFILNR